MPLFSDACGQVSLSDEYAASYRLKSESARGQQSSPAVKQATPKRPRHESPECAETAAARSSEATEGCGQLLSSQLDAVQAQYKQRDCNAVHVSRLLLETAFGAEQVETLTQRAKAALQMADSSKPRQKETEATAFSGTDEVAKGGLVRLFLDERACRNGEVRKCIHFSLACAFPELLASTTPVDEVWGNYLP